MSFVNFCTGLFLLYIVSLDCAFASSDCLLHSAMAASRMQGAEEDIFPTPTATIGQPSALRSRHNLPRDTRPKEKCSTLHPSPLQEELSNLEPLANQMLTQLEDMERRLAQSMPRQPAPNLRRSTPLRSTSVPGRSSSPGAYSVLTPQDQPRCVSSPSFPSQHRLVPSHQVKSVPIFTGRDQGSSIAIDDWVRDVRYLIDTTSMPLDMQFSTIVRYLGGAARKLVLNLPPAQQTPSHAFAELKAQFGDSLLTGDPLASFYERMRLPNEQPSIYAVELEAILRTIEERSSLSRPFSNRNSMLTHQFMRGVKDEKVTQRLAPMRPREMTFRELQVELRHLERESRIAAETKTRAKIQFQQPLQDRPSYHHRTSSSPPNNSSTYERNQPANKNSNPKSDHEVLQDLVLTVRQLAQKVDQMTSGPRQTRRQKGDKQSANQRVFVCHKCGQEGHIARGCRSVPLNSKGPRPKGEPLEALNPQAQ